jgi:hypothetical protein
MHRLFLVTQYVDRLRKRTGDTEHRIGLDMLDRLGSNSRLIEL